MATRWPFAHDGCMTWPSPTPSLLPPPRLPQPSITEPPETPEQRRERSARAAAAWVAGVGGTLVLIAALVVVTSNWEAIGPVLRFAGLLTGSIGLSLIAERVRLLVPTTASITAQLVALLSVPVGVAGAAMLGQPWPVCLVVGGALGVLATQIQAARWNASALLIAQVGAIALAVTGAATLMYVPAGLLGAVAAIGLLLIGAERRAASLAVAAVCSPALIGLADAGIGAGTLERAGLVGERLGWSGPLVGLLAAAVLWTVAKRHRNVGLTVAAIAAPLLGIITGLAAAQAGSVAWWSMPALALISLELGWWTTTDPRVRSALGSISDIVGTMAAAGALIAPVVVFIALWVDPGPHHSWAVPTGVTALALALVTVRWTQLGQRRVDLGIAATAITVLSTGLAFEAHAPLLAGLAVALVAAAAFASRRLARTAVYLPTLWATVMIARTSQHDRIDVIIGAVLLAALVGIVLMARARLAFRSGSWGVIELALFTAVVGLTATALFDSHGGAVWFAAAVIVVAVVLAIEPRFTDWSLLTLGVAGTLGTVSSWEPVAMTFDAWVAVGWFATAATLIAHGVHRNSWRCLHAAAASIVFGLATLVPVTNLTVESAIVVSVALMALLTGLAFTSQRFTPVDTAAIATSGVIAVLTAMTAEPDLAAGARLAIGLQIVCYGVARESRRLKLLGAAVSGASALTWWFTSGLHSWLLDRLAPHGFVETDLINAAATIGLLAAGLYGRRLFPVNSWAAYTPGLAYGGLWLLGVQFDRDTLWATPVALTLGLAAIAAGGWRRLGGPLVIGTGIVAGTVAVAAGDSLADLPSWLWLSAGGLGLLGLAFAIERAGREGVAELRALVDRWD